MKINKVKPYIIYKLNNNSEFSEIQKMLFEQDYCWLSYLNDNHDIIMVDNLSNIKYPFYISNLSFSEPNRICSIYLDRNLREKFDNIFYLYIKILKDLILNY